MASGVGGPDVADAAQETLAIAPTAHAGEQRTRHVLQREVEVRHTRGKDGLDQLVGQPGGIEIQQAGALHPGGHGAGRARRWARGHGRCGCAGPGPSGPSRTRRGPARRGRSHAARARPRPAAAARRPRRAPPRANGSAACPGRTGWRRSRRCGRSPRRPSRRPRGRGRPGRGSSRRSNPFVVGAAGTDAPSGREGDGDGAPPEAPWRGPVELGSEPGHQVDLGQGVAQLVAVALGHATGHDQAGARPALIGQRSGRCRSTPGGPHR